MRAWIAPTLLLLLVLLLAGCASIPLSTAMRFATWDAHDRAEFEMVRE